jgi:methylenetetrahydrofolate reductase (NADPH)
MTFLISAPKIHISYEFFPPKSEAATQALLSTIPRYEAAKAEYISVTYGAGGTTKDATYNVIKYIQENSSLSPAAHLTCVGSPKEVIDEVAQDYLNIGVNRIVALRGDTPGMAEEYTPHPQGYAYADDLVAGLSAIGDFDISVAAYPETHPQATSPQADLEHLKHKQDAGAHRAITQYCFDTDIVLEFVERARNHGITMPIVPGIMMIGNFQQLVNFSNRCGASIPEWLVDLFPADLSPNEQFQKAVDIAVLQCEKLLANDISHFHFYTLNQPDVALEVAHRLGVY